jgi:hypothetical protein
LVLLILFLRELICHNIYAVVHAFMIIVLSPLARVFKVGGEGAFFWRSIIQCFARLVEVNFGVTWGHFFHPYLIKVVEHRIVINIAVGVLAFDTMHQVAVDEIAMKKGAAVLAHSVDQKGGSRWVPAALVGGTVFLREGPGSAR